MAWYIKLLEINMLFVCYICRWKTTKGGKKTVRNVETANL